MLACASAASQARADGDPASDVLALQPLYLPSDANVPVNQQAELAALLAAARRSGYALRVALIASPTDLGSVTALWRLPQEYAQFLGQELSLVYRGTLLVVMPDGYGLYRVGAGNAKQAGLSGVPAAGAQLGTATLAAIQRLAAASGHPLALSNVTAPTRPSAPDTLSWIVFAIGAALIALAWTASLRARPLGARGPRTSSA